MTQRCQQGLQQITEIHSALFHPTSFLSIGLVCASALMCVWGCEPATRTTYTPPPLSEPFEGAGVSAGTAQGGSGGGSGGGTDHSLGGEEGEGGEGGEPLPLEEPLSLELSGSLETNASWWVQGEAVWSARPLKRGEEVSAWLVEGPRGLAWRTAQRAHPLRFEPSPRSRPHQLITLDEASQTQLSELLTHEAPSLFMAFYDGLWTPQAPSSDLTEDVSDLSALTASTLNEWSQSPLSEAMGRLWAFTLEQTSNTPLSLWSLGPQGLSVWREGRLKRFGALELEGVSLASNTDDYRTATLISLEAEGAEGRAEGENSEGASLWVWVEPSTPTGTSELVKLSSDDLLWRHPSWRSSVAPCEAGGWLWGLQGGELWGGLAGEAWTQLPISNGGTAMSITHLWCAPQGEGDQVARLWFMANGGILEFTIPLEALDEVGATGRNLTSSAQLLSLSFEGAWRGLAPLPQGKLALWGDAGLVTLTRERQARWISDRGPRLDERPTRFEVTADEPTLITSARWWLSPQGELSQGETGGLEGDFDLSNLSTSLTNLSLTQGEYELYAELTYEGGERVEARLPVSVAPLTTWSDHIGPLHERACASCHSGTGARDLTGPTRWLENINDILFVVRMQSMPIGAPPLSAEELDLIERWQLAGGPE